MNNTSIGWVYVLTNPSFRENLIKIGFTSRENLNERVRELSRGTSVPTNFEIAYAAKLANPKPETVERHVHRSLNHVRQNRNREFFECTVLEAMQAIRLVAGTSIISEIDNRPEARRAREAEQERLRQLEIQRQAEIRRQQEEQKRRLAEQKRLEEEKRHAEEVKRTWILWIGIICVLWIIGSYSKNDRHQNRSRYSTNSSSYQNTPTTPANANYISSDSKVTISNPNTESIQYGNINNTTPYINQSVKQGEEVKNNVKLVSPSIAASEVLVEKKQIKPKEETKNNTKSVSSSIAASEVLVEKKQINESKSHNAEQQIKSITVIDAHVMPNIDKPSVSNNRNFTIQKDNTPLSVRHNQAKNELLAIWKRLPPQIEIELIEEHAQWEQFKKETCTNNGKLNMQCDLDLINERIKYLNGYIIP